MSESQQDHITKLELERVDLRMRIVDLKAENARLIYSLKMCHHYAGCDNHVCELDGDMCTGQLPQEQEE